MASSLMDLELTLLNNFKLEKWIHGLILYDLYFDLNNMFL